MTAPPRHLRGVIVPSRYASTHLRRLKSRNANVLSAKSTALGATKAQAL